MKVRKLQQRRGWAWTLAVSIVKPILLATTRRTWIDGDRIPPSGGCIVVMNHISHLDPFTAAYIVYDHGRIPRYLAKSGLFKNRLLRFFLTAAGQIPVGAVREWPASAGVFAAAKMLVCDVLQLRRGVAEPSGLAPEHRLRVRTEMLRARLLQFREQLIELGFLHQESLEAFELVGFALGHRGLRLHRVTDHSR